MLNNPQRDGAVHDYNEIISKLVSAYDKDTVRFMSTITKYCDRLVALKVPESICLMPPMLANYVVALAIKQAGSFEWIHAEHEAKEMEYVIFSAMRDAEPEFRVMVSYALQICERNNMDLCASLISTAHAKLMIREAEIIFLDGK